MPTSSSSCTARVRAGTIGSFLDHTLPFLTTDEFIRCHDTNLQRLLLTEFTSHDQQDDDTVQKSIISLNQHADQVQTFLTQHAAMVTLQTSQPTEHAVQNYNNALREFSASQLDRQKASLASNAGREAEDRAHLITQQYNAALEEAMGLGISGSKQKDILTSERLLQWHSILLKDLHSEAGQIRSKTVRAGNTVFCRPKDISSELEKFCQALTNLQQRLHLGDTAAGNTPTTATNAWHAILFAAVAMYGIVDIHPFADGNGRISRIVANWALKAFPFTINVFATPAQRAEYVQALEATRHLLSLSNQKKIYGNVSSDEILQVTKSSGIFAPLVRLLMDRMGRAVVEFHRVWQEKLGLAAEALECKAARQARERAKEGTCIICLDENPNIATLCCGKAVHLNCIAEWLSGKNSCPCCRSELPSISGRVVRAARNGDNDFSNDGRGPGGLHSPSRRRIQRRYFQNAQDVIVSLLSNYGNNHDSSTETAEDDGNSGQDTTTVEIPDEDEDDDDGYDDFSESSSSSDDDDYDSDDVDDDEEDEDSDEDEEHARRPARSAGDQANRGSMTSNSEDDDDNDDGDEIQDRSRTSSLDINILPQDTTTADDEEEEAGVTPRVHEYCDALYCRNRPAIDCTNNLCGRCCVLGGEFHCPRHNS
jgi:fido (protein-threonine AMPylation protein)